VLHRASPGGRALAGCLGAAACPGPASSYEFIAYRHPSKWGTPREVTSEPLRTLDATGATFHTWDPTEDRVVCVPHGPDPVLLGLRGRDAEALMYAATATRPDIAFATSTLAQFMQDPARIHWEVAKRVVRYLKMT